MDWIVLGNDHEENRRIVVEAVLAGGTPKFEKQAVAQAFSGGTNYTKHVHESIERYVNEADKRPGGKGGRTVKFQGVETNRSAYVPNQIISLSLEP